MKINVDLARIKTDLSGNETNYAASVSAVKTKTDSIDSNISTINSSLSSANIKITTLQKSSFSKESNVSLNQDTYWRLYQLPRLVSGIFTIVTTNVNGVMVTASFAISYAYGSPNINVLTSTAFSGKAFNKVRICYTQGGYGYLEINNHYTSNKRPVFFSFSGYQHGDWTWLNEPGSSTDLTIKEENL